MCPCVFLLLNLPVFALMRRFLHLSRVQVPGSSLDLSVKSLNKPGWERGRGWTSQTHLVDRYIAVMKWRLSQ